MSRYLFDKIKSDKSIDKVYFDASGGWSLIPSKLHPIEQSRDEVLATEKEWSDQHETDTEDVDVTEYLQTLETENAELKEQVEELEARLAATEKEFADFKAASKKGKTKEGD